MFGQSSKLVPKSGFLPQPVGVNARGSSNQFFQIAVILEYVSKFGRDPFSELRDQPSEKKEERIKNHSGKICVLQHRDAVRANNVSK